VNAAQWHLQLDQFEPDQVLESRLMATMQQTPEKKQGTGGFEFDFLDALADGRPTPGGGSAAAYSGAAGAALVAMVVRLTIGKKKYASVEEQMRVFLDKAETLRSDLTAAVARDSEAFEAVMKAFRLPKDTNEQKETRSQAIQNATLNAARVPIEVAAQAVQVLELAAKVVAVGNLNAISDGATGGALARAALSGARFNVRINVASLKDQAAANALLVELRELEGQADAHEAQIRAELIKRGGMPLA